MPILEFLGMLFEWHDPKYDLVSSERGITLDEVASVFTDFNAIQVDDNGEYDEQRFITVGLSSQGRLLTVIWTERGNTFRIITAYVATKAQERRYANGTRY